MIHAGTATAVHDAPDGGLLIALAEMAMAGGIGAQLLAAPAAIVPQAYWFGEDQARYVVTVRAEEAGRVLAKMKGADVPCVRIGTTGGGAIAIAGEPPVSIASLKAGFEGWLPRYMNAQRRLTRSQYAARPRIIRSALVTAQLNATVSTKAIAALTMAGRSRSNSQYCSQRQIG